MRRAFAQAGLLALLVGCDNQYAATAVLPEPESLVGQYGSLAAGTFSYRRSEEAGTGAMRLQGVADHSTVGTRLRVCMRHDLGPANVSSSELDTAGPGFRTDQVSIELYVRGRETSAEAVALVTDTAGGRLAGVFAGRMRTFSILGSYHSSIVQGGFNASVDSAATC